MKKIMGWLLVALPTMFVFNASGQSPAAASESYTIENYYRVRWGFAE